MTRLHLPERYERELMKEKWRDLRAQRRAEVLAQLDFDDPVCKEWQPALKAFDEFTSMGRGKPKADLPEIWPGFYHIVRFNPTAPVSILPPITKADGKSFAYPDTGELEALKRADMQDPRVVREQVVARAVGEERRRREMEEEKLVLRTEAKERWRSATETSVSMSGKWSQGVAGRRGRK